MVAPTGRRALLAALAALPVLGVARSAAAAPAPAGLPAGYGGVDPRTARRVPLWQPLRRDNPVFEGDPPFRWEVFTTVDESGYLLERVTSLGTHTGTHISAPAHFVPGGAHLDELDERFTLMPLAVLDVRARLRREGPDFRVSVEDLRAFERRHGRVPAGGCVLVLTGASERFVQGTAPGPGNDYSDPVPGLAAAAVRWLVERRGVLAVGADSFGPDATADEQYSATDTALRLGAITVENVGPGLAQMRPHGDWVAVNGPRPHFSGFQVGLTGFTVAR